LAVVFGKALALLATVLAATCDSLVGCGVARGSAASTELAANKAKINDIIWVFMVSAPIALISSSPVVAE
jgi:hypothetical protein